MNVFFYEHPVFRYQEFASWKTSQGTSEPNSIHAAIKYYLNTGRLTRIRRGLFAVIPPNETQSSILVDSYLIAGKAAEDSVLAYHAALELYGVAYSVFSNTSFITAQKIKPFEYANQRLQPVAVPLALKHIHNNQIEITTLNRQGLDLKVTSIERTFVDALDRPALCGGWEEVSRSLNSIAILNVEAVVQYCLKLNHSILMAKVGYLLEQRKGAFSVSEEQIKPLLEAKPSKPQYLVKRRNVKCHLVKKWNIIVPSNILNQTWEEPNDEPI